MSQESLILTEKFLLFQKMIKEMAAADQPPQIKETVNNDSDVIRKANGKFLVKKKI